MSHHLPLKNSILNLSLRGSPVLPLLYPFYAHAQSISEVPNIWCQTWGIRCGGGAPASTLLGLVWTVITLALSFIAITATGFLVYYGFLYVMSRGEEDNTRRAKAGIAYALIGIVVAGLAAWIVNSVINI